MKTQYPIKHDLNEKEAKFITDSRNTIGSIFDFYITSCLTPITMMQFFLDGLKIDSSNKVNEKIAK